MKINSFTQILIFISYLNLEIVFLSVVSWTYLHETIGSFKFSSSSFSFSLENKFLHLEKFSLFNIIYKNETEQKEKKEGKKFLKTEVKEADENRKTFLPTKISWRHFNCSFSSWRRIFFSSFSNVFQVEHSLQLQKIVCFKL